MTDYGALRRSFIARRDLLTALVLAGGFGMGLRLRCCRGRGLAVAATVRGGRLGGSHSADGSCFSERAAGGLPLAPCIFFCASAITTSRGMETSRRKSPCNACSDG